LALENVTCAMTREAVEGRCRRLRIDPKCV